MDVRCEKCKTEYEFDDARISEAGVTVKCTSCGHVFKVKKKSLVVTVPARPGDGEISALPPMAPAADRPREWKVRQANGNVFNFRELTTLQKWIVERKVSRDDEISLTGESWKRLGNIAELASFFQVVDEAMRAQMPPLPPPSISGQQMVSIGGLQTGGYGPPQPLGGQAPIGNFPLQPQAPAINVHVTTGPHQMVPPTPTTSRDRPVRRASVAPLPMEVDHDLRQAGVKGSGLKWVLILLLLVIFGGAGYAGYFYVWIPNQQRQAELIRQKAELEAQAKAQAEVAEKAKAEAEEKARLEKARADADAKAKATAVVVVAPVDAGSAEAKKEKEAPHDFEWWMARGDRLRESDRPEAALDAYGKAAEMEPDRAEPLAGKGLALNDMGHPLQAEASFQQALNINPRFGDAVIGLAETYKAQGRKQDALKYYQKYVDEHPTGPDASVARAAIKKLEQ
ncbi:MAG TPA: zinc-ribbon domain-containing protein [Myxococcaceae bacterium]|nr:zinc-ribbon domain-containing protein [Myxococcaceae bacterium]